MLVSISVLSDTNTIIPPVSDNPKIYWSVTGGSCLRDSKLKGSLSRLEVRTHVLFAGGGSRPSDKEREGGGGGAVIQNLRLSTLSLLPLH